MSPNQTYSAHMHTWASRKKLKSRFTVKGERAFAPLILYFVHLHKHQLKTHLFKLTLSRHIRSHISCTILYYFIYFIWFYHLLYNLITPTYSLHFVIMLRKVLHKSSYYWYCMCTTWMWLLLYLELSQKKHAQWCIKLAQWSKGPHTLCNNSDLAGTLQAQDGLNKVLAVICVKM